MVRITKHPMSDFNVEVYNSQSERWVIIIGFASLELAKDFCFQLGKAANRAKLVGKVKIKTQHAQTRKTPGPKRGWGGAGVKGRQELY